MKVIPEPCVSCSSASPIPPAVDALSEIGIGISDHRSKRLTGVSPETADLILTLCAEEVWPFRPGPVKRLHGPLNDPSATGDIAATATMRRRIA